MLRHRPRASRPYAQNRDGPVIPQAMDHLRGDSRHRAAEKSPRARPSSAVAAPAASSAEPVLAAVRTHLADDLDAPGALAAIDRWAEETRLRSGAAGAEDTGAGVLVRDVAAALLGVEL